VTTVRTCLKTLEETDLIRKESIHQGRSGRPLYIYYPSERKKP
jgi:predicted transcriptional regulator